MAKLDSKQNPLILRIADESNMDAIAQVCVENGWHYILGVEPDEVWLKIAQLIPVK